MKLVHAHKVRPLEVKNKQLETVFGKKRVFLIYEQKLLELLRFCPKCGALVLQESIEEVQNECTQAFVQTELF